jgi:site-specific DNA-methyltransferase (adenine-specific)
VSQTPRAVHETALGTLYEGCGVSWLEAQEPESVDLVVADPPYNLGKSEWDRFGSLDEYLDWSKRWVEAARRALKPTGQLYVCGFSEILAEVLVAVRGGWTSRRWLVWYYRNKANLKNDWGRSHESVLLLRKGKRFTFNTDPVRVPYNAHTTRYPERTQADTSQYGPGTKSPNRSKKSSKDVWTPHPLGARPRDVLEIPVLSNGTREKTPHPTQKPVQLIRRLVLASSDPGDLVVDPFAGSGTTAAVAEASGRRWATCELEPDYLSVIRERLASPDEHLGQQSRESESAVARRRGKLRHA